MNRESAEAHWKYTLGIIERLPIEGVAIIDEYQKWLPLLEYLYVEALLHGYKHGSELPAKGEEHE